MTDLNKESGSGEKTKVILVSRVHKEAADERMTKLIDEYEFIEGIPEEYKDYFPRIVMHGVTKNKAFYEMEHFDLPTLRRLMLANEIDESEVLDWCDRITAVSRRFLSHQVIDPIPQNYFNEMHFDRLDNRMVELTSKSDWFKDLISKDTVSVNGKIYKNIMVLVERFKTKEFLETVKPEFVGRWSHADLHFSNVLIDRKNDKFIMIDPRGYDYCDYYYDYGKFWHSVNGKYEMIASRNFNLYENGFELYNNDTFKLCESLKKTLPNILYKHSTEDPIDVMRKTEWNEVIHFASLVPFLLDFDGLDSRAKVAYYTSVILINDFCEKYEIN